MTSTLSAYYPKLIEYKYNDITVPISLIGPIKDGLPGPSDHLPVIFEGDGLSVLSYNSSFVTSFVEPSKQMFFMFAGDHVILKYLRLLLSEQIEKSIGDLESANYFLMFSEFSRQIVKFFFDNRGSCAGLQEQNHTDVGVIKTINDVCPEGSSLKYQTGSVKTGINTYPTLLTIWDTTQLGLELIPLNSPVSQPQPPLMYKDKDGSNTYGGKYEILQSETCESYVADLGNKAASNSVLRDKAAIYTDYGYKNPTGGQDDGRPIMITLVRNVDDYTLLVNFHAPNFPKYVAQRDKSPINIDTSREYVKNLIQAHVMNSLEKINEEERNKIRKIIVMCDSNDTLGKLTLEFKIGKRNFSVVFSKLGQIKSCCVNCDSNEITACDDGKLNYTIKPADKPMNFPNSALPYYESLPYKTTEEMERAFNINSDSTQEELKETFYAKNFKFYGDYAAVLVGVDAPRGGRRNKTKKHRKYHIRITKKRRYRNTKKRHKKHNRRSNKH